jgi:4-carboxymuconolactone decarboxylase
MLKKLVATALVVGTAMAQDRLPMPPADKLSAEQKKTLADLQGSPFIAGGPFVALLREPKLAEQTIAMASFFRNESVLDGKITEFLILLAAREWTQHFEWATHYERALNAGLKQPTIDAIAQGRRPLAMPEDQEIAYDFWNELEHNNSVSDATYDRAVKKFGERGVVTIAAISGFYSMLARVLNVSRAPVLPANAQVPQLAPFPK